MSRAPLVLTVVVLSGCELYVGAPADVPADAAAVPDEAPRPGPFEWIVWGAAMDDGVTVRVDGSDEAYTRDTFPDDAHVPVVHTIDTVVNGRVITHVKVRPTCDADCGEAAYLVRKEGWFAYASGELRMVVTTCDASYTGCSVIDSDEPRCRRDGCPGARCGLDRVDDDPSLGWLACVPIGPVGPGDACTIDAAGIDDCAANLHCVDARCQRACEFKHVPLQGGWVDLGQCGPSVTCTRVPGTSPEVGVCAAPP